MRDSGYAVAGVQQNLSYKHETFAGNVIEVTTGVLEVRDKSVRFLHEMRIVDTGEIAATCEVTAVHLDSSVRKATPWPPEIRWAAMERLVPAESTVG